MRARIETWVAGTSPATMPYVIAEAEAIMSPPVTTGTDMKRGARRAIVGVMGAGENARAVDIRNAFALGSAIADAGWVVLSGGRNRGVMDAVSKGAKTCGGLTVGVLPSA